MFDVLVEFWSLISFFTISGADPELKEALSKISELIRKLDWKVKNEENEMSGIEHPGLHMMLKKLAQNDSEAIKASKTTFGECLCSAIDDDTVG